MATPELETTASRIALGAIHADLEDGSLPIFWDQLNGFDWGYEWSDDHSVYEAGRTRLDELRALATLSPRHARLFQQFEAHERARNYLLANIPPKPQRPS